MKARRVLIFSNFYMKKDGAARDGGWRDSSCIYRCVGPGVFQANPYGRSKHIGAIDLTKRVFLSLTLAIRALGCDVIWVDSAITAALTSIWLMPLRRPLLCIAHFNLPRRRSGMWVHIWRFLYRRVSKFVVHSHYDIRIASELLRLPSNRFVFMPYRREQPDVRASEFAGAVDLCSPFIISVGGNARDYRTFLEAASKLNYRFVVVARDYNLQGLSIPDNVQVFSNIPLRHADYLVSRAKLVVLTFDGSEPSCGQISVVTAFMLGKPVIVSESSGMEAYVVRDFNGLTVPLFDVEALRNAIVALMEDGERIERLSRGAQEWAVANGGPEAERLAIGEVTRSLLSVEGGVV